MKPLIKWVGGKRRFLKELTKHIPKYDRYIELFAGSAALFFELRPKKSILNDLNCDLINFYRDVKNNTTKLFDEINNLMINVDKIDYYELRDKYNNLNNSESITKSAIFFYLNKVGFNGIYRVNSLGKFNVPKGTHKSHLIPTLKEFQEAATIFKRAELESTDFRDILNNCGQGDFVYLDPPYYPDESSKFVGYTDPVFDERAHEQLVDGAYNAWISGAEILISNSNSTKFKELIDSRFGKHNYECIEIQTKRSINPKAENKDRFVETLYVMGVRK